MYYVTTGKRGKPVPRVEHGKPQGKVIAGPFSSRCAAHVLTSPDVNNPHLWSEGSARALAALIVGPDNVETLDA